jgi:glycosyltransferase involved in cell wall biosynthesis
MNPSSSFRILIVNDHAPAPGSGAEVHIARLAEALRAQGQEVRLFAGTHRHHGIRKALDVWDPLARRALRRAAEEFGPDIVHYHNVTRELSASVLSAVPDAARVLTVHDPRILGVPDGPAGAPIDAPPIRTAKMAKARLERAVALRNVDVAIALTRALGREMRGAGFGAVQLVPNLAPPGPEPATTPSACDDVLFAGRLAAAKGCAELISAFARVAGRHPASRLVFAGDGAERASLESLAARLIAGRVTFLGVVPEDEIRSLMERARLLAMPSLGGDVSPNVVIEAAFAGRPIVITALPGIREFVDEAGCGLTVPPGDIAALADALDVLLSDPARADAMGDAGRRTALATRTPEVAARRTIEIYRMARWRAERRRAARERPLRDRVAIRFGTANRRRKAAIITELMRRRGVRRVLLVGVGQGPFEPDAQIVEREICAAAETVFAVDLHPRAPGPWGYVRADALHLPFQDDSFDLVVSNAVIEHVGGEAEQRLFVAEHLRVARAWVITTPNRWFPIEAHTRAAFRHWSPAWRSNQPEFTRLLSRQEFEVLLPAGAALRGSWASATFLATSERLP